MRTTIYIAISLLTPFISRGQIVTFFQVTDTVLTDSKRTEIEKLKNDKKVFYEDENYFVSKSCSGEWGGTVKFKNKKTGIERSCEATCPVTVNKLNDKYYLTNSLGHLSGFSEVLEIADPEKLEVFKMPPPRKKKGKNEFRYVGDDESKSKNGTKILVDSVGVLTLGSFIFERELYHIVTNYKGTYIAKIIDNQFKHVDFITDKRTYTYDNELVKTKNDHLIITISGGYLDIYENQIKLLKGG